MSVPTAVYNELFMSKLASPEGIKQANETGETFIRDRLREVAFTYSVLPPIYVKKEDCQVSVNHDTLVKIVELEPQSRAMTMSFRGEPTARFIRAERIECAFHTITTEKFEKTEQELLAYTMPITKIIEENSVKDMQEIIDRVFVVHTESAVQALQAEANGGLPVALNASALRSSTPPVETSIRKGELARVATTNSATVLPIQRPDVVNLFKMFLTTRLRGEIGLITEHDWDDQLSWTTEDVGSRLQSETTVEGYVHNKLLGKKFVRTIKTDILRPGNVYAFTKPSFLGRFFILNNPKFYIDKVANHISFQAWMDVGMCLANIASIRKLELYSGDANPLTNADGLLANFIPMDEDQLGAVNNRVAEGLVFPRVLQY